LPAVDQSHHPQSSKAELIQTSREIESHIIDLNNPIDIMDTRPLYFENNIVFAIRDWSEAPGSHLLRIGEPAQTGYPSTTSEIFASVVKTASKLKLAALYISCSWIPEGKGPPIINTLYLLIVQLINQLDFQDADSVNFNAAQLQDLDGTIETWDKALSVFSDLLIYAPSPLFIVIDNLQRLDELKSNGAQLDALIQLLRDQASSHVRSGVRSQSLKILFTTTGPCASLSKLDEKVLKKITIRRRNTKPRPGEARLGRSQIQLQTGKETE
jgi:hypothetical protein